MRGTPIPNRKIEEEKAHLSSPGEVIEYKMSPKEIEEKFKKIGQATWSKPIDLNYGKPKKENNEEENELSERLTMEMVKKEISNGLTAEEISKKYNKDKRPVTRMVNVAKRELAVTYEEQEEKVMMPDVNKESTLKLVARQTDFEGEELRYRIQNDYMTMLKDGTGVKIALNKLNGIIKELQEINEFIKEA